MPCTCRNRDNITQAGWRRLVEEALTVPGENRTIGSEAKTKVGLGGQGIVTSRNYGYEISCTCRSEGRVSPGNDCAIVSQGETMITARRDIGDDYSRRCESS